MNIIKTFTKRSLQRNRKRTIVTIIGVMLSAALISAVAGMVATFHRGMINYYKDMYGTFYGVYFDLPMEYADVVSNNVHVISAGITEPVGCAEIDEEKSYFKKYLSIVAFDETAFRDVSLQLIEGRLPENDTEILMNREYLARTGKKIDVGDSITLKLGYREYDGEVLLQDLYSYYRGIDDDDAEKFIYKDDRTYTVVGIMESPNNKVQNFNDAGFVCITGMTSPGNTFSAYTGTESEVVNVYFTYDNALHYSEYTTSLNKILGVLAEGDGKHIDIAEKSDLATLNGGLGDTFLHMIVYMAIVVIFIIVATSIFVISNSFRISVNEKKIQFGMLSSVGATKKQIRRIVLREGLYIGAIGTLLGIGLGVIVTLILTQITNYLIGNMLNLKLTFVMPWWVIILDIVLSAITIYFSCIIPAINASKIAPIDAIRGNTDIKIKGRKLRTSRLTKKLFGMGGVIASKNLKRSRRSYRTTVVSLVLGVSVFIALSTFVNIMNKATGEAYKDYGYDISVFEIFHSIDDKPGVMKDYEALRNLEGVKRSVVSRELDAHIDGLYLEKDYKDGSEDEGDLSIIILNKDEFAEYMEAEGISKYDTASTVILRDDTLIINEDGSYVWSNIWNISAGDKVPLTYTYAYEDNDYFNEEKAMRVTNEVTITARSKTAPLGYAHYYNAFGYLIVCDDFFTESIDEKLINTNGLFLVSDTPDNLGTLLENTIKHEYKSRDISIYNIAEEQQANRRIILLMSILLYGFIIVITLIGITNIFNTINTNMAIRAREFAMLRSVGMTGKEFNRMIRLESIMYGSRSLLIGIPLGLILSYLIYRSAAEGTDFGYTFPIKPVLICIIFVAITVWVTMQASLGKIKKQNIIETIRRQTY